MLLQLIDAHSASLAAFFGALAGSLLYLVVSRLARWLGE